MKLLILSDLHLEIEENFTPIKNNAGDVMIVVSDTPYIRLCFFCGQKLLAAQFCFGR